MPITPNIVERTLFFEFNQAPSPLIDIWSAVAFRAVLAGIQVGIFESLDEEIMPAEMLAEKLNLNEKGAVILLETLRSLGYLEKDKNGYRNSAMTSKWLVKSSGMDLSPGFRYWAAVLPMFDNLDDSLRSGSPPVNMYEWLEDQPQVTQDFQDYMVPLAKFALGEVTSRLKISTQAKRLLDVGGGHAMYSIAMCRQHPSLSATVFDSVEALESGRENISKAGMESKIQVQAGNFITDDLGSGYDIALLFNISHGLSSEQNIALLKKVAKALNQGGYAVILEQFGTNLPLPMSQAVNNILGLSYFHLLGGQVYTYEEVLSWFEAGGYGDIQRINLRKVPGNSLVIGVSQGN